MPGAHAAGMNGTGEGRHWLGADPGGVERFGIARLFETGEYSTGLVSSVADAVPWVSPMTLALGVDAPLWWSSSVGGWRAADEWIRSTYRMPAGHVQSVNSLRGAAVAQGIHLVRLARETRSQLMVTEVHPKALCRALGLKAWTECANLFGLVGAEPATEHERDAVIAAVAAREGFSGRWTKDLSRQRGPHELEPASLCLGEISYWWP